jgi:hypothetical protein
VLGIGRDDVLPHFFQCSSRHFAPEDQLRPCVGRLASRRQAKGAVSADQLMLERFERLMSILFGPPVLGTDAVELPVGLFKGLRLLFHGHVNLPLVSCLGG